MMYWLLFFSIITINTCMLGMEPTSSLDREQELLNASFLGDLGKVKVLLKHKKVNPDVQDYFQETPLHLAAYNGNLAIVQTLLEAGARVDIFNELGNTPLHQAASMGHAHIVDILLRNNAQVNSLNNSFETPLHRALRAYRTFLSEKNKRTVYLLIKAGASIVIVDIHGKTTRDLAAEYKLSIDRITSHFYLHATIITRSEDMDDLVDGF